MTQEGKAPEDGKEPSAENLDFQFEEPLDMQDSSASGDATDEDEGIIELVKVVDEPDTDLDSDEIARMLESDRDFDRDIIGMKTDAGSDKAVSERGEDSEIFAMESSIEAALEEISRSELNGEGDEAFGKDGEGPDAFGDLVMEEPGELEMALDSGHGLPKEDFGGARPGVPSEDFYPDRYGEIVQLSEERLETILTRVVEEVVERVTRKTMTDVMEKVLTEALEGLRAGLEPADE